MKRCIVFLLFIFSTNILANDLARAPKNFSKNGSHFVFVNFKKANYKITYDIENREAVAESEILFFMPKDGFPLFDLVPNQAEAKILSANKFESVELKEVKLTSRKKRISTAYKSISKKIKKGEYSLKIKSKITELVTFRQNSVKSAFWMSDLSDRSFLEKYLPTNLDYDNYQMNFNVHVKGTDKKHILMINCLSKRRRRSNQFSAKCPSHYNSSGLYFHLFPEGAHKVTRKDYKSINGRIVKVVSYGEKADRFLEASFPILEELENDYGAWPYPFLIVYGAGFGGMEYNGATRTSMPALGHELHHTYFARGIHPAGGNGGWIDEAMASWRDDGYPSRPSYDTKTKMAGHSMYRRDTDRNAYSLGARIIAHFDYKFKEKGGMKAFMKNWADTKMFSSMTTLEFRRDLEQYFNVNLKDFFDKYIYGKSRFGGPDKLNKKLKSETLKKMKVYHRPTSKEELIELL